MVRQNKKNLLLISFSFAPSSKVGAKRFSYLSYYFKKYDSDVTILTVKKKYYPSIDNSLKYAGDIYETVMVPIFPIDNNKIKNKIFLRIWESITHTFIDPYIGWIIPGIIKGYQLIKKKNVGIIIVTGPPFSSFLIGYSLSKILNKVLILDYRDPWTLYTSNLSNLGLKICKLIEKKILIVSKAIIFNTERAANSYRNKKLNNKIHVISNAYDSINNNITHIPQIDEKIIILYAGNFYGERKLSYILKPLNRLFNEKVIGKENIEIHIFGKIKIEDNELIKNLEFDNIVKEHSKVDYKTILSYMKRSDILYLPQGGDVRYSIPYKFFDYLSVRKPILAVTAYESALFDIMQKIDCGECADIYNSDSIFFALKKLF